MTRLVEQIAEQYKSICDHVNRSPAKRVVELEVSSVELIYFTQGKFYVQHIDPEQGEDVSLDSLPLFRRVEYFAFLKQFIQELTKAEEQLEKDLPGTLKSLLEVVELCQERNNDRYQ